MTSLWAAPDAPEILRDGPSRDALRAFLLAMADDELVLGHRHSEWTGFAPDIESDVALSSIAQDEMGHARLLYEQVAVLDGTAVDTLAFGRAPDAFHNAVLTEQENGDWAYTILRAWLYDQADAVRLAVLGASPLGSFVAMAKTLQREEKYHLMFTDAWLTRLSQAGGESLARLQAALHAVWPDAAAFFEPTPGIEQLVAAGSLQAGPLGQATRWKDEVGPRLMALGLDAQGEHRPVVTPGAGRAGRHTPALAQLLDEMTSVWRIDPDARW